VVPTADAARAMQRSGLFFANRREGFIATLYRRSERGLALCSPSWLYRWLLENVGKVAPEIVPTILRSDLAGFTVVGPRVMDLI
jgi:hypothetical protein